MGVIGVIPARGGSQRLPDKNLLPILGRPLVAYTIEAALRATTLDRVVVSTDHSKIADIAKNVGAEVVMRPEKLATAEAPIDDSVRHVVRHLEANDGFLTEIAVLMQANNPVRKKGEIDEVVHKLMRTPWATAVATAYKVSQRPEWAKILSNEETKEIRPFMDAGISYRIQDLPELYLLDGSVIAVRADVLQKTTGDRRVHAYLGGRVIIEVHNRMYAVEVDELEDGRLAEFHLGS